ncbi:MAG: flagellar biosynthesis anti-sigma factor FlgM [Candidatus Korobacteraceae bacterium]
MEKLLSQEPFGYRCSDRRAPRNPQKKIKVFLTIADHSIAGDIARGTGMTIDLKRLLKKCRKQISGGLSFTPTSAKPAPVGGPGSPAQNGKSKALNGTSEDESLQSTRWDLFFSSLLNPQAIPAPDHRRSAGSNGQDMTADAKAVMHSFTWSAEVQILKAHLDKVPDIRQQRVDSLKQAMAEGRYQLYPQQIAAAMFAEGGLNLG